MHELTCLDSTESIYLGKIQAQSVPQFLPCSSVKHNYEESS